MHIGIDIGGSNLVAGLVNEEGKILSVAKCPAGANRGLDPILQDLRRIARECVEKSGRKPEEVKSIGIGAPGLVDRDRGLLLYSNNLPFNDTPIAEILNKDWGIPVYVENDANCAALGELYAGAARGANNAVVVTIGTGIGGGIILNGKLFSGAAGAGAEIGHIVIEVDGEPCTCGRKGCWEAYGSATGLKKATRRAMAQNKDSLMWALCDGNEEKISAQTAFDAAKKGDQTAKELVDWYIRRLSAGIINIANVFRPELICLGGGVSNEDDAWFLEPVRAQVEAEVYAFKRCPVEIRKAQLGNDAGIIGAAFLYRQ